MCKSKEELNLPHIKVVASCPIGQFVILGVAKKELSDVLHKWEEE